MSVKIAARKSDLARLQAYRVGNALQLLVPELEITYEFSSSLGDRDQETALWAAKSKGLFTQDFVESLAQGEVDLVVHSWKDLPIEDRPESIVAATLPRADARDMILFNVSEGQNLAKKVSVMTSSPRRIYNLQNNLTELLPGVEEVNFIDVRGNIPTRLRKLRESKGSGLVVAKAAIDRLLAAPEEEFAEVQAFIRETLAHCRWMILPYSFNPPAAAQGALAIEVLRCRTDLIALLEKINCAETKACVEAERKILKSYGGGCHQKIGVIHLVRSYGHVQILKGESESGEVLSQREILPKVPVKDIPCDKLWPLSMQEAQVFRRVNILTAENLRTKLDSMNFNTLLVSRASAWPKDFLGPNKAIWTAGLRTWRQLAQQGVWVNGCAEAMGFEEPAHLEQLLGEKPIWLKLSHNEAPEIASEATVATYKLVPQENFPDLSEKTHFFWLSGSNFKAVLEKYPQLISAHHSCGPGHTKEALQQVLGKEATIHIFLSHASWLATMMGE